LNSTPSDADEGGSSELPSPFGEIPVSENETYKLADAPASWSAPVPPVRALPPSSDEGTVSRGGGRGREPREEYRQQIKQFAKGEVAALIGFNAIVFVTSVCIMTLELTASRLVGKHVGNSLYTWTSVIGVVLAGITIGNYIGGYLADLAKPRRSLAWMFLISSITCWSVLWLDQLVPSFTRPASISWPMWVLLTVSLIFFLPACAMGAISPIVASLAVSSSSRTGMTMGNVYAWGALGSIVGTFLTGFYLIDQFGTRAIVGLVALTLAGMALIIASSHKVFRVGVALGWCQLLILTWGLATISESSMATAAGWSAKTVGLLDRQAAYDARLSSWRSYGGTLGQQVHDLGLTLGLRDDQPGQYHDESSYSYINVSEDYAEDGRTIKYLKLDKLIHSYYDPSDPTRLDYDYEKVYAAITEHLAGSAEEIVTTKVTAFPGRDDVVAHLPQGLTWDAATETLSLAPRAVVDWSALLRLAPDGELIAAINELGELSTKADWGGFSSVAVSNLPENFTIPLSIGEALRYDSTLEMLSAWKPITADVRKQALAGIPSLPWIKAMDELKGKSRKASSLFIGGGGFIFPRWIEANFPGSKRIDVAELDPAVLAAVQSELGLAKPPATRINARIGDARNVVDDLLRESSAAGGIQYDFVYGDAFNDFSVPWHLTTREFAEKIDRLLSPRGVYLINVIDVYPRTEWPRSKETTQQVTFDGEPPFSGWQEWNSRGWIDTPGFPKFSLQRHGTKIFSLRYTGVMPDAIEEKLKALGEANVGWKNAVADLARLSRVPPELGTSLPAALLPSPLFDDTWIAAPAPFEFVEIKRSGEGHSLAVRGALSPDLRDRLITLQPEDLVWKNGLLALEQETKKLSAGRFLASFVATLHEIFPHIAVFSSEVGSPHDSRDTFVIAASKQAIDWKSLGAYDDWKSQPFATSSRVAGATTMTGQMESLLTLTRGLILTDDHAPVDNLLLPVFETND
jgi:predicted membrane-bound spermidine synthase